MNCARCKEREAKYLFEATYTGEQFTDELVPTEGRLCWPCLNWCEIVINELINNHPDYQYPEEKLKHTDSRTYVNGIKGEQK